MLFNQFSCRFDIVLVVLSECVHRIERVEFEEADRVGPRSVDRDTRKLLFLYFQYLNYILKFTSEVLWE